MTDETVYLPKTLKFTRYLYIVTIGDEAHFHLSDVPNMPNWLFVKEVEVSVDLEQDKEEVE